jgi:antibiotic biosynthesis monooxygenase (ABM) superfamily enzyme
MRRGYNPAEQFRRLERYTFTVAVSAVLVVLILAFSYFTRPQENNLPNDTVVTTTTLHYTPNTNPNFFERDN